MATNDRPDPILTFHFCIEIDGVREASFTYFSGISAEIEPINYRQHGVSQHMLKLPGQVNYGDVTLRYGVTASDDLWRWFDTGCKGQLERRNVSVLMLGPNGQDETFRWNLIDAWIKSMHGGPLDARANEVAVDEITLVCERVERA